MTTTKTVDEAESGTIGRRQLLGLLGLGLGGSLLIPQTAVAASTATATELVNVRAKPSTTAEVLGQLAEGDKVTVISTATNWTRIRFEGGSGYVARRYLRAAPAVTTEVSAAAAAVLAGSVRITTAAVNLREGPGAQPRRDQGAAEADPGHHDRSVAQRLRRGGHTASAPPAGSACSYLAATTGLPGGRRHPGRDRGARHPYDQRRQRQDRRRGQEGHLALGDRRDRQRAAPRSSTRRPSAGSPRSTWPPRPPPARAARSAQDHRLPLRHRRTEHPLDLQGRSTP